MPMPLSKKVGTFPQVSEKVLSKVYNFMKSFRKRVSLQWHRVDHSSVPIVEAKLSKFILMMPKTQVKNQESNKFQE